jgi:hypothetical protein
MAPVALALQLTIAPDGTAQLQGEIRSADPPRVLVAPPPGVPATCSCADANGNGVAGLVGFTATIPDVASGAPVPVVGQTLLGQDLDVGGDYAILLQVGEARWTLSVRVVLVATPGPDRRHRKRRRQRRRRKKR